MEANNMNEAELKKLIEEQIKKVVPVAFIRRKLTDTPTDDLQITPRKYVTRYSTTALRPRTSVLGEFYFDTTAGKPVWWRGDAYVDAAGNVIS